jgi:hypothetical protein
MNKNLILKDKKIKMKNNSIITYQTNIHINIVDKEGKITSQSFGKKYNSLDVLVNRQQAIEYLRTKMNYFFYEEPQVNFLSHLDAKLKGYKDFMSLSVSIWITDDEGNQFYTDCSEETVFDFLSFEYNTLKKYQNIDFILVKDECGDVHKVIQEEFDFFEYLIN